MAISLGILTQHFQTHPSKWLPQQGLDFLCQELRAFHEQIVRRTENGKAMVKLLQADEEMFGGLEDDLDELPSGDVKIAIENGHRNSGFYH